MDQYTLKIQKALVRKGFKLTRDGIMGPATEKAIIAFKKSIGYRATPYIGPLTKAALFEGRVDTGRKDKAHASNSKDPVWLKIARSYIGLREYRGSRHNKQILAWWQRLGLHFRTDEVPWCAGFSNGVLDEAGIKIVKKNRAAALGIRWNNWGTTLKGPALGAIMTMKRRKPGSGHVGFVVGRDSKGNVMLLGGNQGNAVSINPYDPTDRDAKYHWPEGHAIPSKTGVKCLPLISSTGKRLTNEA